MMYFSRLKTAVILGLCLLGAILCIPNIFPAPAPWMPWRTVHLGLDLRGGSYLLMQVDMNTVVKERLNNLLEGVRQALRPHQIFYQKLQAQPDQDRILLQLRNPAQAEEAAKALKSLISQEGPSNTPDLDIAAQPNGIVTLTLSKVALNERASAAVQQSIEIVRRRVDDTGVVDPQIERQGAERIVVQLPGISDPDRIKQLLGKTAHMTFHMVDEGANANSGGPPPPGDEYLPMQNNPREKIAVLRAASVDGADLTDARAGTNPESGEWVVNFSFNAVGARKFADITRANVGQRFAIVLDNKVISAPVIREPITGGRGQISGNFTATSATDLAVLLRAGALPAPLTRGGGAYRRSRTRRRQHPRRCHLAGGRLRAGDRLHGDRSMACSAGSRMSACW